MDADALNARMFLETDKAAHQIIAIADIGKNEKHHDKVTQAAGKAIRLLLAILASISPDKGSFAGISDFSKASLVYFRGVMPGKVDTEICRVVQIPLYFEEVKQYRPLAEADLAARQRFAHRTGFLLLAPDECLAIEYKTADDHHFVSAYDNNDLGHVRNLAGYYARNLDFLARLVKVSELNVTQTKEALALTLGNYHWWWRQLSELQRDRLVTSIRFLEKHTAEARPERTSSGAIINRSFIENGTTESTVHLRPHQQGWIHYPTRQDAWYFGIWINNELHQTLSYAEQDVAHVICENPDQFWEELKAMALFHGRELTPSTMAWGDDVVSVSFDCLTLLKDKTVTVTFAGTGTIDKENPSRSQAPLIVEVTVAALTRLSQGNLLNVPSTLEAGREFAVNILDPRAFTENIEIQVTYKGDLQFEVLATMEGQGVTHTAMISLTPESA
ncbi:hypothetical protein [Rhodoferax ferrireducens]|nr:hypothetical protein [Rhodoferax ferrireducens]